MSLIDKIPSIFNPKKYNYYIGDSAITKDEADKIQHLERQLEKARSLATDYGFELGRVKDVIEGINLYIEAECHEAWVNDFEGREGAFVDMAKKMKQLKGQGNE